MREHRGAGRLAMGLHDSMRRLAKIAAKGPCLGLPLLALDVVLFPQSPATALPAYSTPQLDPLHNIAGRGVVPDSDPTSVRPRCLSFRRTVLFVQADTCFSWVS